jgi:hypothetical protein
MGTIVQALLGILILASLVFAFLGARTWHWGQVLLVIGIFLSTLGFFILSAETLRINKVLRTRVNQLEQNLANVNARNDALQKGSDDSGIIAELSAEDPPVRLLEGSENLLSLAELDHRLLLATRLRGRVWRGVAPTDIDAQTGAVTVNIESPAPVGLKPADGETVVYVFEQGPAELPADDGTPRGAQFLGEFRVIEATGQQAKLLPVLPFDHFEQRRLAASRGPWAIYEMMPPDRHAIFAGMSDEQIKQKLPRQSVVEYLRHGKPAGPDDPPERVVGFDADEKRLPPDQLDQAAKKVYQRRLRDYATEFDDLTSRRIGLEVDIAAVKKDIERLTVALASARELQAFRTTEKQRLGTDLAGITKERAQIESHLAKLRQQLAKGRALLAETLRRNNQLADELAARRSGSTTFPNGAQSPNERSGSGPLVLGTVN